MGNRTDVSPLQRRAWAEIDIGKARQNYIALRNAINPNVKICCVVKANAYGHGAVRLATEYEKLGSDFFAVSNIEEAIQLRDGGISSPILILGYTDPGCARLLSMYDITQCVFSREYAESLNSFAKAALVDVNIHVKLDTGMGRLGFFCDSVGLSNIISVSGLSNLKIEGIFTHFSCSDEGAAGLEYTRLQIEKFKIATDFLEKQGIRFKIKHCSNSAAALDYPEAAFDMVRLGIVLYGCQSDAMLNKCELHKVMTLKTVIDFIKEVPPESFISYGREGKTKESTTIATIPIGYADGLWRSNYHNSLKVALNGHSVSIIGRVCMDQCMLDISDIKDNVSVGDEVIIFGEEKGHTVDDIASLNNTISYEILCSVGARVSRIYK